MRRLSGGVGIRFNNCPSGKIVRCTFTNNDVIPFGNDQGGGIWLYSCGSPSQKFEVSSSNFHDNSAANGGGIFAQYSWADVRQCTFDGNSAYGYGGGLFGTRPRRSTAKTASSRTTTP
jgi:predicted outer membrane repeat protein